jgi:hypothetical protein
VLWPRPQNKGIVGASNHIGAHATYIIPPSPGKFEFDDDVGKELFYVAVSSDPTHTSLSTELDAFQFETNEATDTAKSGTQMDNISVRGLEGLVNRGVVFAPGVEDTDPHVYFSAKDQGTIAAVEFQLQHEE